VKISSLTLQELFRNHTMRALDTFAKAQDVRLYLVGGSVRDLLLKRQTTDFDFTLASDAIHFAKAFAANISATCIVLEENPPTARVIIKQYDPPDPSRLSMDFVQLRAASLSADLRLRDLTINAMAIVFENVDTLTDHASKSNFHRVIDPCRGIEDLGRELLRFPSEQVILADPIRLLRIYRFAAQLGFEISQNAIAFVQKYHELLPNVAAERCRDELMKILDVEKAQPYLQQMDTVGLLAQVLPVVNRARIPWQPLETFEEMPIPTSLGAYYEEINNYLQEEQGDGVSRRSLMKLSLLLGDNFDHIGEHLQLSRKATQFIVDIISKYEQFFKDANRQLIRKQIICFLRTAASDWWGVLLYAAALRSIDSVVIKQIADTYYEHILPIHKQGRLITGDDLIQIFHLKEGKQIGDLLEQIEKRQFNGEIRTREEALDAVEILIRQSQ
jgi:tRNA nucleotidyltransferase/poly(A) polymerase